MKKLQRKVKKEKKGALRELRRDTEFIEHERLKQHGVVQAAKDKKRKEVWRMLEEQQRDTNLLAGKKKKNSGVDTSKARQSKRPRK